MGKLINFSEWGTEKEMKKIISNYMKENCFYDKEHEEFIISENLQLQEILGLEKINKRRLFDEFMHFLLKKSPEQKTLYQNQKDIFPSDSQEKNNKMSYPTLKNTQSFQDDLFDEEIKIRKKKGLVQTKSTNLQQNENLIFEENNLIKKNKHFHSQEKPKDVGKDFFDWQPTKSLHKEILKKQSDRVKGPPIMIEEENINEYEKLVTKQVKMDPKALEKNSQTFKFGGNFDNETGQSFFKSKKGIFGNFTLLSDKTEDLPFRKTMNWLVKTETSLYVSSINSQIALERLWPKEAELLF